jgi:hypothetical protein
MKLVNEDYQERSRLPLNRFFVLCNNSNSFTMQFLQVQNHIFSTDLQVYSYHNYAKFQQFI